MNKLKHNKSLNNNLPEKREVRGEKIEFLLIFICLVLNENKLY
jgi:hypothetical protein